MIGKQVSKAIFTSVILCLVFFLLGYFGFTIITITGAAMLTYIPLALAFLLLWYLIGRAL